MSENLAGLTALQENVVKTKEHVESVRSALDTAKQNVFQYTTMLTPSVDLLNRVVQFVGTTTSTYTHGYFYNCTEDGQGGYTWEEIEFGSIGDFLEKISALPTATSALVDTVYLLVDDQTGYTKGGIYQCQETSADVYEWVLISASSGSTYTAGGGIDITNDEISVDVDDDSIHVDGTNNYIYIDEKYRKIFIGTQIQWDNLSAAERAVFDLVDINDAPDWTGNIDSTPTENSPNAVASGGVYQAIQDIEITSVPEGGTTGQVLTKKSGSDYDTEWKDAQSPLESGAGITIADGKINADTNIFHGTVAEYEALSQAEQMKYSHIGSEEENDYTLPASAIPYNNTSSGLSATNVQGAIDELKADTRDNGWVDITSDASAYISSGYIKYKKIGTLVLVKMWDVVFKDATGSGNILSTNLPTCDDSATNKIFRDQRDGLGALYIYTNNTRLYCHHTNPDGATNNVWYGQLYYTTSD